ncbi:MAG TPA: capsid cement protein [Gemmataceae bacterium]|nr:capsid cement protein [Gemmataceae bacterium]
MSDAVRARDFDDQQFKAQAAYAAGKLWQLRDGQTGYLKGLSAVALNDTARFESSGMVTVPKTTGIAVLDGGHVYWDRVNSLAHFKRINSGANNRDFYLGRAVGDALTTDQSLTVNLNVPGRRPHFYDYDLGRDPFTTAIIKTAGVPALNPRGGWDFVLDTANEAQKVDALGNDGFAPGAKSIIEMGVTVVNGGSASNAQLFVGIASGTHATTLTSITQLIGILLTGNSTAIQFLSQDGTNTTAATSSTKTYTASTRFEIWIDLRNPAAAALYVDGVPVLTGTAFNVSAAALAWKLLVWCAKSANATPFEAYVDWLNVRNAEQSVNGV